MKLIAGLIMLLVLTSGVYATPDDGIIQHETLVGYNSDGYYCIQLIAYPTGIYYAHKDSAFLITRDFHTASIKSRIFISSRNHVDNSTWGNWQSTLTENKDFNLVDFIKAHSIRYLYPEIYSFASSELINFKMGMDSLNVITGNGAQYRMVLSTSRFQPAAPWIKKYQVREGERNKKYPNQTSHKAIQTRYFYGDDQYMFMLVSGEWDAERSEIIIAFDRKEVMPVVEKYRSAVKY